MRSVQIQGIKEAVKVAVSGAESPTTSEWFGGAY